MVTRKALKMRETTTEKRARPERTHSRVNPPANNRNTERKEQISGFENQLSVAEP